MNYIPQTIKQQAETIKKYLGITMTYPETLQLLPDKAEHYFLIPKWNRVGKTYAEACNTLIAAIKKQRKGKVYQWAEFTDENLKPIERNVPEIVAGQFGELHKGESVKEARAGCALNEVLTGLYETCIMLLTHPDRLEKYKDLWIDCGGDQFKYGSLFSGSPVVRFGGGGAGFGTRDVDFAYDMYGAGSLFFPQLNLEIGIIEPLESSFLESAIKVVKDAGYKVIREY